MEARRNRPRRPFVILRLAAALILSATVLMVAGHLGGTPPRLSATTLNLAPVATSASVGDPVVAAAGDIACDPLNSNFKGGLGSTNSCHQKAVSDLLVGGDLSAVMLLGDNQYYCGSYSAFQQSYDKSWGRVKGITMPAVGNHEYITANGLDRTGCDSTNAGAAGHFRYFGAAAGDPGKGYYSYDVGTWHVIVLNSSCSGAGGCSSSTQQGTWLRNDLATHKNFCTMAYWHVPLYSSGGRADSTYKTFWDALYAADADLVLNGHDHTYERFAPQTPTGVKDTARGLREFVVGTGGANHTSFTATKPNSEVRNSDTFGVLRLTLHPTGYDWKFAPEAGKTFTDSGSTACHGVQGDTTPPTAPTNVVASATGPGTVNLTWDPATDAGGVAGYKVFRGTTQVGQVTGTQFVDDTAVPSTTYTYTVAAYDTAGNTGPASAPSAPVTTPDDTSPPTVPSGLKATSVAADRVDLAWTGSQDNVQVAGYDVLRGGVVVGTSSTTSYSDTSVTPQTPYSYTVRARDSAGNTSGQSSAISVTTPAQPTVLTFRAVDDTYVRSDLATSTFGGQPTLQVDGSPAKNVLMRFTVSGIAGRTVTSAKLSLAATDGSSGAGSLFRTDGSAWDEGTVTWNTRPATSGAAVATLGKVVAGTTYPLDLTSLVTRDGTYDLEMTSTNGDGADFASDEGTGTKPTLEVTVR